ncbi:MAG TPA: biopolymer transporter ExbD [Caulobacteraceae bacterium]|jgi:biopolymer transport protein ExbD|nr:biopolymer transporter ExbD [Caulobacteraceae bacterium]
MAAKLSGPTSGKKYTIEANSDINVTPFVDIMLVLLIIFMVSIPPSTAFYKIDMPPAPLHPPPNPDTRKPVIISLNANGNMYLAGAVDKQTSMEAVVSDVSQALRTTYPEKGDPRNNSVFLRADADVKYDKFMDVLNTMEDAGYSKLGLINEDIS